MLPDIHEKAIWRNYAACADMPTSDFFYDEEYFYASPKGIARYIRWRDQAIAVCETCPSINACRDYAERLMKSPNSPEISGIWGGEDDYMRVTRIRGQKKCRRCQKRFPNELFKPARHTLDRYTSFCPKCVKTVQEQTPELEPIETIEKEPYRLYRDNKGHFISREKWESMNV